MTEQRQRRIDTLNQAARRKSETATKAAEAAIRTLVKRGEPVTFQAVQRTAGVSHSFLYTHPALRERIEHGWSGIYKTTDGGKSLNPIALNVLIYRLDLRLVYTILQFS